MARVLILGGGFGGVASAHALRSAAKDSNEVLLVDQRSHFAVGFRKSWGLFDPERYSEGLRPLASLSGNGIEFRQGTIESVSPNDRTAVVDGKQIEADSVILALGAEHAPTAVPGFGDHVHNLYESDAIGSINESFSACGGGRVGIGIFGTPYTCPPAPYEIAYLLREYLEARDIAVEIEVFTPKPMSLPVLGQAGCSVIEDRLTERGIRFLPNHQATRVEAGRVHFTTGPRSYDLILGVPPPPSATAARGNRVIRRWLGQAGPRDPRNELPRRLRHRRHDLRPHGQRKAAAEGGRLRRKARPVRRPAHPGALGGP